MSMIAEQVRTETLGTTLRVVPKFDFKNCARVRLCFTLVHRVLTTYGMLSAEALHVSCAPLTSSSADFFVYEASVDVWYDYRRAARARPALAESWRWSLPR